MDYIKKTFKDKRVWKALAIIAAATVITGLLYPRIGNKSLQLAVLIIGSIVTFTQFPAIYAVSAEYAEEETKGKKKKKR